MATENEGLLVQIGATEKAYIQQLARMEARTLRAALKSEKAFKDANPKIARSFEGPSKAAQSFSSHDLRGVAMQLSQVAQQGSATGNYLQALAIQLPDLALGLGTIGIAAGVAAGALLPLAANALGAFDAQAALKEESKRLEAALSSLQAAQDSAGQSVGDMAVKYGAAADEARANLLEILSVQKALAAQGLEGAVQGVSAEFEAYLKPTLTDWRSSLERISEAFGVTRVEARTLAETFNDMRQATTFEEQRDALERIKATLEDMGVPLKQIPEELLNAFLEADKLEDTAMQIEALLGRSVGETQALAGGIGASADEAARLAENLGISLEAAARLAALGPQGLAGGNQDPSGKTYSGRGGDPRDFGGDAIGYQTAEAQMFLANWKPPAASSGRKPGSGGSSVKESPLFGGVEGDIAGLERQIEMIGMTADQVAALTTQYQLLDEAKKRKLDLDTRDAATGETLRDQIARQAETVGALTAKYEQAAEQQQFFDQQTEAMKSGVIDAIVEGENLAGVLESVAKSFAKAALEAALFGSGPFAASMGGSGGGFFGGLFGTRAGGGSVAAGRTYLVGENGPELFSSDRAGKIMTASDTKAALRGGGSGGGGGGVSVSVHNYGTQKVETQDRGNGRIDVIVREAVTGVLATGGADKVLGSRFGVKPKAR